MQIFVNKALTTLFNFPLFSSDFLGKNAIDLQNSFIFKSKLIFLLECNVFNSNISFFIK